MNFFAYEMIADWLQLLATIFLDLLMSKEDYLKSLRALLREIVRTLRHDFTFHSFCVGLMEDCCTHPTFQRLELPAKERLLFAVTDLVAVCELLTISPAVREASATATSLSWGDKRKGNACGQVYRCCWNLPCTFCQKNLSALLCNHVIAELSYFGNTISKLYSLLQINGIGSSLVNQNSCAQSFD